MKRVEVFIGSCGECPMFDDVDVICVMLGRELTIDEILSEVPGDCELEDV